MFKMYKDVFNIQGIVDVSGSYDEDREKTFTK